MINEFLGENIKLRKTIESDLEFVLEAASDHETEKYILTWSKEQHLASISDPDILHLIVESKIDNRKLGFIILAGLGNDKKDIEFKRIVITEKGKGTGRESIKLIKKMAFEKLNADRLWLDVMDYNLRAHNLYLSEGFKEQKVSKNVELNGKLVSLIVMAISRNEFLNI